jgi:hypothetical protein
MKRIIFIQLMVIQMILTSLSVAGQYKSGGIKSITSSDLKSYLSFLASPLLKGRMNGEEGLEIASQYIASQAQKIGLKPANGNSFFQHYTVVEKLIDPGKTNITVITEGKDSVSIKEPFFQLYPIWPSDFELEGEVVFAGYGIKEDKNNYNDFDSLETTGKILLVMNRAPMTKDGNKCLFEDQKWIAKTGLQQKLLTLIFSRPKAIMFVTDPKSGSPLFEPDDLYLLGYRKSLVTLKGQKSQTFDFPGMPKILFIHRKVADELLKGTGKTLADLQNAIDNEMKSHSFAIKGKRIKITETSLTEEIRLPNVAGIIEGRDPVLKNEIVIFSGHMDHIGEQGSKINAGADDDASGCSALLEMAEAFQYLQKKPLRSVLFLWVSGEEIGLTGSQYYVNNPFFPLDKTVADLNMDMIGRVKGVADTSDQNPMTGPNSVFVITDNQSKELLSVADAVAKKINLTLDYSLSGRNHPLMLFARSDHYNFVQKDIPVLFFTTGLHTDYHTPGDVVEKIDFEKMEKVTRTMYEIGYRVANRKTRITVDNPFSKWTAISQDPVQ